MELVSLILYGSIGFRWNTYLNRCLKLSTDSSTFPKNDSQTRQIDKNNTNILIHERFFRNFLYFGNRRW